MDAGDKTLVRDEKQRHSWSFVDASTLRFDDAVFDLIAHSETVPSADCICFCHQLHVIREGLPVDRNWVTLIKLNGDDLWFERDILTPGCNSHDRLDDRYPFVQMLQILRFVRRTEH